MLRRRNQAWWAIAIVPAAVCLLIAQPEETNYDESKVPNYTLPDPLVLCDGAKVQDANTWREKRRPEILELFREHVYGRDPGKPNALAYVTTSLDDKALDGKATRKQVAVYFTGRVQDPNMAILIYLPNNRPKHVPLFLGLNFYGNHAIHPDPGITLSKQWMRDSEEQGVVNNRAPAARVRAAGPSSKSLSEAMAWPRSITATSTPISTMDSKTASTACSMMPPSPPDRATHGVQLAPGPGGLAAQWTTSRPIPISIRSELP